MQDLDQLTNLLLAKIKGELSEELAKALEKGKNPSLKKPLKEWLVVYEKIIDERPYKSNTRKNHKSHLNHVARLWGNFEIGSLKPIHIAAGLKTFLPDRPGIAQRVLQSIVRAYDYAIENDWAEINPASSIKSPHVPIKRKRLSFAIWLKMYKASRIHPQKWIAPMLLVALITGQRRADVAKMRFADIVDGYLQVEQQKKAGKLHGSRLAIPLDLHLPEIQMSLSDVVGVCENYEKLGSTLIRKGNGKSISLCHISNKFNELIRECLDDDAYLKGEWPSFHEIRSLSERLHRKNGVNTKELLGHSSQEMTDRYNDDRGLTAKEFKKVTISTIRHFVAPDIPSAL